MPWDKAGGTWDPPGGTWDEPTLVETDPGLVTATTTIPTASPSSGGEGSGEVGASTTIGGPTVTAGSGVTLTPVGALVVIGGPSVASDNGAIVGAAVGIPTPTVTIGDPAVRVFVTRTRSRAGTRILTHATSRR